MLRRILVAVNGIAPTRRWRVAGVAALVFTLIPVWLYTAKYPTISPIDEFQHIDYAMDVADGKLVGLGDRFGTQMMREFSCRMLDASEVTFVLPPCDAPDSALNPDVYPEAGYNVAYIHPPTYYANAAVGGIAAETLGLSFVTGARLANLTWLVAFVAFMLVATRWTRCSPVVAVMACVVCVVNPAALHAFSTVNPDAAGLACGAGALVGYLGWRRSSNLWWLLLVIAPVLVKSTHALVSGAILCLMAAECWLDRPRPHEAKGLITGFRPVLVGGAGLVGAAGAVLVLQKLLAFAPTSVIDQLTRFHADSFPIQNVLGNIIMVPPLSGYMPRNINTQSVIAVVTLATLMVMIALFIGLANRRDPDDQVLRNVGVAALSITVLAGPALMVLNYGLNQIYVQIPSRYLVSLMPLLVLVGAAGFARNIVSRWGWILVTAMLWGVLVYEMLDTATLGVTKA